MRIALVALMTLASSVVWAQAETLQLTFETNGTGPTNGVEDFRPANMVVVWLERQSDGAHVATLTIWGVNYAHNFREWSGVSAFGTDGVNDDGTRPVDAVTGATQKCYTGEVFDLDDANGDGCGYLATCGTCSLETMPALLDTGAIDISGVPDGDYTIEIELVDWELPNPSANGRASIPFTKDGTASAPTAADQSTFSNISVTYTGRPGANYRPGVFAGPDASVTPTTTAALNIPATVTDAATPTIAWSVIDAMPAATPGCVVFTPDDAATTDVSFCQSGIFLLGITADDGTLSTHDELIVYVNAETVTTDADAAVRSDQASTNFGGDRFLWSNATSRVYMRFDLSSIAETITAARFQYHGVESIYTDNDREVLLVGGDTWDEMTINWNNQPGATGGLVAGSYLSAFGLNRIDLATAAVQDARFTDGVATLFIQPGGTGDPEWTGYAAKETGFAPPELVVVKAWVESNTAPTAAATVTPAVAVADAAGVATITLDGSGSSDPENNITLWDWQVGGSSIAAGESTTADLSLGIYLIDLVVEDSLGLSDTDADNQVIVDDRYSGNDSTSNAQTVTTGTHDNLFAYDTTGDWFLVTLSADGGLDVDIAFLHADGDLNLHVYQDDGTTLVDESTSSSDDEGVSISGLVAGDYIVHVPAASGNAAYSLTVAITGAPQLSVSFSPTEVLENADTVADIGTVSVDTAPATDLAVTLSSNNGDVAPESPVTILAGQSSVTFDVTITDDSVEESDATATVTASATAHTSGAADLTIRDDDGPLPIVSWASAAQTVSETDGTATVTVTMTQTSLSDVVVPFTVSGTATGGGVDYMVGSTDITVPNGETTADLTFVLFDDSGAEGDETVIFTLGTPTGATTTSPLVHLVTITDDESVSPDGGPVEDGGTTTGDPSVTPGDEGSATGPSDIILESSGCACDQTGAPTGGLLLALALGWRRRRHSIATSE